MDVFEAIEKRHSYRGDFQDRSVPREDLEKIVQAGIQAPSRYNGQSTTFVIVDDADLLSSLGEIVNNKVIRNSKAAIVVAMDPEATADKEFSFGVEDYSAAVENMLLAITAMGYASVWIDGVLRRENRAAAIADLLEIPKGKVVRAVLPLGIPVETRRQKEKKSFQERAWYNKYRGS